MSHEICQSCGEKEATVHLTEIVSDQLREVHYCDECAQKAGVSPLSPQSFFAQLMSPSAGGKSESGLVCPSCGLKYSEFRSRGRLGCPECYGIFSEGLLELLEKIHGSTQHRGMLPGDSVPDLQTEREIVQLKRDLARAIQREEYEEAAEIRDRIREMEESEAVEPD